MAWASVWSRYLGFCQTASKRRAVVIAGALQISSSSSSPQCINPCDLAGVCHLHFLEVSSVPPLARAGFGLCELIFPVSCVVQVTLSSSDLCHRVASHRVAGECNWFAFKLLQVSQVQVTFSVCSVEHYHDESIKLIKQIKSNQIDYTVNLNKNDWIGNATTLCNAKPLCRGREKCKV